MGTPVVRPFLRALVGCAIFLFIMGEMVMASEIRAVLFGDYPYGMTKAQIEAATPLAPCPDNPGNAFILCNPKPVLYLQRDWRESFIFNNESSLQEVVLVRNTEDDFETLTKALGGAGWVPVSLETDDKVIDIYDKGNPVGGDFPAAQFSGGDSATLHFFPKKFVAKTLSTRNSFSLAMDDGGEAFVLLTMMWGNGMVKLSFTAPLLSRKYALRYGQMIKR